MRRASLLLVALLVVSAGAFAQEYDWNIEVEASATFGVQLDEFDTGISNAEDLRVRLDFIPEVDEEFGESGVGGWIEVEEMEVQYDSDDGSIQLGFGDINARVYLSPTVWIDLEDANVGLDEASDFTTVTTDVVSSAVTLEAATGLAAPFDVAASYTTEYPGVALHVELPDLLEVEFGAASFDDWTDTTSTLKNAYVLTIDGEIAAVENLEIDFEANAQFGNPGGDDSGIGGIDQLAGVGVSFEYALSEVAPGAPLAVHLGVDYLALQDVDEDTETRLEVGAGVSVKWADLGLDEDEDDHIDFLPGDEEVTSGFSLGGAYAIHNTDFLDTTAGADEAINTLQIKAAFFEDGGDDGLLPTIGGALMVNYNMVMENEDAGIDASVSDLGLGAELSADLGTISPYFGLFVEVLNLGAEDLTATAGYDDTITTLFLNVGTDINVLPNTTFTIDYASGDLLYDDASDSLKGFADTDATYGYVYSENNYESNGFSAASLGVFSVETTVEF